MTAAAARPVRFRSGDVECVGDLYLPEPDAHGRGPIVVLGHGLGGTRAMGLAAYAQRFVAAGLAALTFDYRHFGDSGGEPRELISIPRQLEDWAAAIAFAQSLEEVDPARVAIWGTSFGGGHVLRLAAHNRSVAAAVAQCPFTDGIASSLTLGPTSTVRVTLAAIADVVGALLGRAPIRVAAVGPRGSAALMTAPDALPGYRRLAALSGTPDRDVAARIGLTIARYRPGRELARIAAPTFICVCDPDSVAPNRTTEAHIRRAANPLITSRAYRYGHFEIYFDAPFEQVVADQIEFLLGVLAPGSDVRAGASDGVPSTAGGPTPSGAARGAGS
jgi:dienelactone hydrolase